MFCTLRSYGALETNYRWSYRHLAPTEPGNRVLFCQRFLYFDQSFLQFVVGFCNGCFPQNYDKLKFVGHASHKLFHQFIEGLFVQPELLID